MAKTAGEPLPYNAVFIDTSLDTHLATIVSFSDTVSDLKQKIIYEHSLCFPQMGDIKIHALKVKRKGCLYHLSDSVSVCSVFNGLNTSWFIKVDASLCEKENNGCIGVITDGSAHVAGLLPDAGPENLLLDVIPGQNLKHKAPGSDEQMSLDVARGDVLKNLEVSVEGSGGDDKDLSVDANDNSPDEGNELEKTLVGGSEISLRNEIGVQGKVQPATVLVPSLDANDNARDKGNEPEKTPVGGGKSSSMNEIGDMQGKLQLETVLETESHKQKKHKGRKRSRYPTHELSSSKDIMVPETVENESWQDVAASLAPQEVAMENVIGESGNEVRGTAAASGVIEKHVELKHDGSRRRGAELHNDEPMEDALQSEHAVKKKRKIKKKKDGDEYIPKKDGSSVDDSSKEMIEPSSISQHSPGDEHNNKNPTMDDVHLQSAGGSSGNRKRKKKSKDTPDQEIVAPFSGADVKGDRPALGTNPQSLGEESDALLAPGIVEAGESSERGAVSLNGHPIREANKRLFHQDFDKSNSDAVAEGRYDESRAAVASDTRSMKLSDSCTAIPVGVGSHHRESDNTKKEIEASRNESMIIDQGVNEMNRVDDGKNSESKTSEKHKVPALKELTSKSKEASVTSNLLEADETVHPPKPSKKIKKFRKAKEVGGRTILTSAAENVEGFVSVAAPVKPDKDVNGDHTGDNVNREESNAPSKEGKELTELETSAYLSVTEKEIDEVIQNAMHSVQQIGQVNVRAKIVDGKSTKKTRKKRSSEAKSLPEVGDENQKPSAPSTDDNLKKAENSSNGPPHSPSSEGQQHHTKSNSEGTDNLEVYCESSGINFNNDFVLRQHNDKIVGPAEVLVDRTSEAIIADVETKTNNNKKKLGAHSHDPSPDLQNSHSLPKNHGVGGKHVKVSDSGTKAPSSSKLGELDSVPEKIRSTAVKPSATSTHAKSKRAASNSSLESSKGTSVLSRRVNGRQPNEDHDHKNSRKTSRISVGKIVNAIQHKKSVIGALDSIFNDVTGEASSTEDDSSDASTRTPSDKSPSSDYSDGESNADFNFSRNGSDSWKRRDGDWESIRKPISSGVTLDTILRSSSRYKKAKLTASQMELEDTESRPVEFVPDSQAVELGT